MSSIQPTAIIWDLDGTLVDSVPDLAAALNRLLGEYKYEPLTEQAVRQMIGHGVGVLVERGFEAVGETVTADALKVWVARFLEIYSVDASNKTTAYPGAMSAVLHFAAAGVGQAVCTNKPAAIATDILTHLGFAEHFVAIVGGDSLPLKKPSPEPLHLCLEALKCSAGECLMVGDSDVDVATARAAGMRVGVVTYGYAKAPAESLGADFLIDNLGDLPRILNS